MINFVVKFKSQSLIIIKIVKIMKWLSCKNKIKIRVFLEIYNYF